MSSFTQVTVQLLVSNSYNRSSYNTTNYSELMIVVYAGNHQRIKGIS